MLANCLKHAKVYLLNVIQTALLYITIGAHFVYLYPWYRPPVRYLCLRMSPNLSEHTIEPSIITTGCVMFDNKNNNWMTYSTSEIIASGSYLVVHILHTITISSGRAL